MFKKKLTFRLDDIEGKALKELYDRGMLLAYALTKQRSNGDELLLVFCPASKTLSELLKDGGAVHQLNYLTGTNRLNRAGPFMDFSVADFMDVWDRGVNGVVIHPELEVYNAPAIC